MKLKEYQNNIIEALAKNEEVLCELYELYGKKLPRYKQFWLQLSLEEMGHAAWIHKLRDKVKDGSAYFTEGRFNIEAIQSYSMGVKKEIAEISFKQPLLISAMSNTYYFEMSLLERKYFEIFEGDSAELKHLLMNLADATKNHKERVSTQLHQLQNK